MNKCLRQPVIICLSACGLIACNSGGTTSPTNNTPSLNPNNLNLIFVQGFESNSQGNNLSITGFNHSLQFGAYLNQITQNNVNAILALDPWQNLVNGYPNMGPIQSIENYTVLTAQGIVATLPMTIGSYYSPSFPSIAYYIDKIIAATSLIGIQNNGNFVIALPAEQINQTLAQLSQNPFLSFSYTPISNSHQFVVLSIGDVASVTASTYNDGINSSSQYPNLNLTTGAACLETPVSFTVQCNPKTGVMNANETAYLVRHVEAHPVADFDNGNYVCQGQWRAIGSVNRLEQIMGGLPNQVYSSDPGDFYGFSIPGSPYLPAQESYPTYVRPSLTINPFVIKNSMELGLVPESNFNWDDYKAMAEFFFQNGQFSNQTVLISWEHSTTNSMANYLVNKICQNPNTQNQIPVWASNDYDTVWKIKLDNNGSLTFSNTCEGISSASLPISCPKF